MNMTGIDENALYLRIAQLESDVLDLSRKNDMLKSMVLSYGMERMKACHISIENDYTKLTEFYSRGLNEK